jgi:large subunit ribosomal protein L23
MNTFEIVRTVRLTEKGTRQGSHPVRYVAKDKDGKPLLDKDGKPEIKERPLNQYTVVADPRANKTQIRQAVQELFKVKVIKVNTLNVRGKFRRQRTKQAGQAPNWKKAIVTLKEGDKIVLT